MTGCDDEQDHKTLISVRHHCDKDGQPDRFHFEVETNGALDPVRNPSQLILISSADARDHPPSDSRHEIVANPGRGLSAWW